MFIFGGKKKRKTLEEVRKELAKKYGLPEEVIDGIIGAYISFDGYVEFIRQIDPEKNYERVKKTLAVDEIGDSKRARAILNHEYHSYIGRETQSHGDTIYSTECSLFLLQTIWARNTKISGGQ
ncbi:hypothetical protein CL1_1764 [Thermococcus cleftensis]|uniref:Uncharacterized protein n=2 Tax=Thermococcus cleftensis (strain DSM 27260 / KACC 17922 / CL1) TaxID=163003 RepID=I3ZW76_THECF|nr:hypothetical protein CL1_1764 [Thermococcus cleftensis]